jgi:peptide/nickel transport system substrate-binding protein
MVFLAAVLAVAVLVAGCGGSKKKTSTTTAAAGGKGGTFISVATTAPSGSPDPQVNYTLQEWQLLIVSHDGLVAFKRVSGAEGGKIVPDLAESIPKPTNGGKTWAFKLRSGIKFSNGQTLTGKDVKATFERLFKIGNSPNAGTWYNVIQGGDACVKTPKTCNLSKGIVVNGNTVTFNLTKADPEFPPALSVHSHSSCRPRRPTRTSTSRRRARAKWVQYAPTKQIKLVRNPSQGSGRRTTPARRNPDSIVQKFAERRGRLRRSRTTRRTGWCTSRLPTGSTSSQRRTPTAFTSTR